MDEQRPPYDLLNPGMNLRRDVFRMNEIVVGKLAGEDELYTYHGYKPLQR
jgi:hypothetical protein